MLKAGHSQTEIAQLIGVDKSTISRELKRNSGKKGYRFSQANRFAMSRRHTSAKRVRFTEELKAEVLRLLKLDWSPEQISGRLKAEGKDWVSHERIYQFIYNDKAQGGDTYKYLRRQRPRRRKRCKKSDKRGQIPNRVSIDLRDAVVDKKSRVGDWEIDTIIGKNHQGVLLTAVERKTKFTCIAQLPNREAESVAKTLIHMLMPYKKLVHTITADNGKEFSKHETIAKDLKTNFFFAHPYCAWERAINENTNGLIRQYFPKKSSLNDVEKKFVLEVQNKLNHRPRKLLNFKTPFEVFNNSFVALGT